MRELRIAMPAFGETPESTITEDDRNFAEKTRQPLDEIAAAARRDIGGEVVEVRFDHAAGVLEYRAKVKVWASLLKKKPNGLRAADDQADTLNRIADACVAASRAAPDVVLPIRVLADGAIEPGSAPLKSRDAVVLLNEMRKTWSTAFARCLFIDSDAAAMAEPNGFAAGNGFAVRGTLKCASDRVRFHLTPNS